MKERIDPLIAERANWLFDDTAFSALARDVLMRVLGYGKTIAIAQHLENRTTQEIMRMMGAILAKDIEVSGLDNIPRRGPAIIVANHPTGVADGIMLHHALSCIREDLFVYANSDILRVLPQMDDLIVPVEWRLEKRSHSKTRATMSLTRAALEKGQLGVIFPAGRLAKRRGLKLYERQWMPSAAMIARKFDVPVIPVNIRARNSALFYLFDRIHPSLRDITLFYETLNKDRQPFRLTVGAPIDMATLPSRSEEAIDVLRRATLALGGPRAPEVSLVDNSRQLDWVRRTFVTG
ncbi:MAG: lysophospholipid acyltransferase family protein [Pseudomonadota bacterium]